MLWCAPKIRAKRLYCFSSVSPFVLLCLKGVGGKEGKNTDRSRRERKVEKDREGEREREGMSHEQVACLLLLQLGVLIKHSLAEFAWCFRTTIVMSRSGWSRGGLLGRDVDHF